MKLKNYYGFIYKWIDSTNGKTYTGSRKGSTNDGYTGSGKLFKEAYEQRPEKFSRKILEYVYEDNRDILLETEQKYLDLVDWTNTYNISRYAQHGGIEKHKEESKRKIGEKHKGKKSYFYGKTPWNKGLKTGSPSSEIRQKQSESQKRREPFSKETRQKQSDSKKGEKNPMYGKSPSKESRHRMSESAKKRWKKNDKKV